jgi:hypothetical protein
MCYVDERSRATRLPDTKPPKLSPIFAWLMSRVPAIPGLVNNPVLHNETATQF